MDICVAVVTHMEDIVNWTRSSAVQNVREIRAKCVEDFIRVPFLLQVD